MAGIRATIRQGRSIGDRGPSLAEAADTEVAVASGSASMGRTPNSLAAATGVNLAALVP